MRVVIRENGVRVKPIACTARRLALSSQIGCLLSQAIHDQRQTPSQESSAEDRDRKREIGGGPPGACPVQEIVNASLNHEDR
jgi:hypothetical protein